MTGEPPPPTPRTPEELIALLIARLIAIFASLIDAAPLPSIARARLHEAFAELFARLEATLIKLVQQRAPAEPKQPKPITTSTAQPAKPAAQARRQRTKRAPSPASAPTETSPIAEAPHPKRAPAPHHPTRAPRRAVAPSTQPTIPSLKNFQKPPSPPRIRTPISLRYQNKYHCKQVNSKKIPLDHLIAR